MKDIEKGERIAKVLARAGLCSRRDAERWIEEGRIEINGKILYSPAFNVIEKDTISVEGVPLPRCDKIRVWRYYKPFGLVTTHKDPQGRPTIFSNLPSTLPRVISVGRLDLNSEGLLLLTNAGVLAHHLESPSTGWIRRYRVRVFGTLDEEKLKALTEGITIDGIHYGKVIAHLDRRSGNNSWLTISLREGKNREIRKIMSHFGCQVNRLIRLSFGPFPLGNLEPGEVEEIPARALKEQLGHSFKGGEFSSSKRYSESSLV